MITTIDIYRSLRNLLNGEFTELVEVKDIKNPTPPCFYIKPVTDNFSQTATNYGTTNYLFSIVFFSGEETLLELLNFKENLKKYYNFRYKLRLMRIASVSITYKLTR